VEGRPPPFGSTLINFFIFRLCPFYRIAVICGMRNRDDKNA
jgi:hypothetical protein